MGDDCPKWAHKIPENVARWLNSHHVTQVNHNREMTGADTSRDWLTIRDKTGNALDIPTNFERIWPEAKFAPYHAGLIQFDNHSRVRDTIEKIDAFRKRNADELSVYKRLKAKFEGTTEDSTKGRENG